MSKILPIAGDLVRHYLFTSEEWLALVLKEHALQDGDMKSYVRMIPGVKLERYFSKYNGPYECQGWVYTKWIWVYKE